MIRLVWFLLKVALLVAVAVWLADHPGRVTFIWQGYEVTTSVALVLLAVLALCGAAALLYSLWRTVISVPDSLFTAHLSRRQRKGYMILTQGLMAVAAGDAQTARKLADKAGSMLKEPSLTLLLQAQAAQLAGDDHAASRYYSQMLERPEMSFLGLRGLVMQATRRGDDAQALALVRRAQLLQPKAEWVLNSLVDLEARTSHWEQALEALTRAARQGTIAPDRARRLRCALLIGQSDVQHAAGQTEDASYTARKAHELNPNFVPAVVSYARLLLATDRAKLAGKIIERLWRTAPHASLVPLYLQAGGDEISDEVKALRRLERLASHNPDAVESRLMLAQAALNARLWGIASDHLAKAASRGCSNARYFTLRAELEKGESGDPGKGQDWLMRLPGATPDPVWQCTACQGISKQWQPRCPSCQTVGEIDWRMAGLAATLPAPLSALPQCDTPALAQLPPPPAP